MVAAQGVYSEKFAGKRARAHSHVAKKRLRVRALSFTCPRRSSEEHVRVYFSCLGGRKERAREWEWCEPIEGTKAPRDEGTTETKRRDEYSGAEKIRLLFSFSPSFSLSRRNGIYINPRSSRRKRDVEFRSGLHVVYCSGISPPPWHTFFSGPRR